MNRDRFRDVEHLGDGAYVGHDGYQVWVWASDGVHDSSPVALDRLAIGRLAAYARQKGVGA